MKDYDSNRPLFAIHVPKTGGVSVKDIFKKWYGDRLLLHYFDRDAGQKPPKYDLDKLHSKEEPIVVYGHFNRSRNFGIEDYYPEANQFIAILRDPFETAISRYFFTRRKRNQEKHREQIPERKLRDDVLNPQFSILNFFPCEVTVNNYKEIIESQFIEIGITEYLDESMSRIARKLDRYYDGELLRHLNKTERDIKISDELRDEFTQRFPLDIAVYNYVLKKYV